MFGQYQDDGDDSGRMMDGIEGGQQESTLDSSGIGKDSEFLSELVQLNPIAPLLPPPLENRTPLPPLSSLDPTTRRKSLSPPRLLFHPDLEFFKSALPDAHSHFNRRGSRDDMENSLSRFSVPNHSTQSLGFFPSDPEHYSGQLSPVGFHSFGKMQMQMQRGMMNGMGSMGC